MDEFDGLKEEFLAEAREHLSHVEDDILQIERDGENCDVETINHLFRAIHSIKGSSSFLDLTNITELSHALENVVGQIREKTMLPNANVVESLLNGIDKLRELLRSLDDQGSINISSEIELLHQLISSPIVSGTEAPEVEAEFVTPEAVKVKPSREVTYDIEPGICSYRITLNLIAECDERNQSLEELFGTIHSLGNVGNAQVLVHDDEDLSDEFDNSLPLIFGLTSIIDDQDILLQGLDITPLSLEQLQGVSPGIASVPGKAQSEPEKEETSSVSESQDMSDAGFENPEIDEKNEVKIKNKESSPTAENIEGDISLPAKEKGDVKAPTASSQSPAASSTVRIPVALLDKLMNLASELVLVRNQNMQTVERGNLDQLKTIAKKLNVVTSELQTSIMQTRMQTIDTVFSKFTRVVRDLSKKLKKEISLDIYGREVELDKNIIEAIGDPLTHIIRNSIDHGIEAPGEREAKGKSRIGKISIGAFHRAGHVNIKVEDDGSGIDPEIIKRVAIESGIISSKRANTLSNIDAFSLLFEPGFSTANDVTDISGRGVGMDVVKTNFQKIGGVIDIDSEVGKGTSILIRLPLTLMIMQSLIVAIEDICFAIPQFNISEVVWLHGEEVYQKINSVDDQEVLSLRGKLIPILRLARVLGIEKTYKDNERKTRLPERRVNDKDRRIKNEFWKVASNRRTELRGRRNSPVNSMYILILKLGHTNCGLIIDTIIDTEEIVVKSLHNQMESTRAFAGTTVLGDGRIAMILDVPSLAELGNLRQIPMEEQGDREKALMDDKQAVLIFNIGGQETFAIPLFLINHITKISPNDIMIANNKEYLNFEGEVIPLIRIENALRSAQSAYTKDVYVIIMKSRKPIGIIASEITDNILIRSTFDSSTMNEPGIIGVIVVEGNLTLILDVFKLIEQLEPEWFRQTMEAPDEIKKILLLEDTQFYAYLIRSYLMAVGLDVVLASNGKEGIEALSRDTFDFIISDLEMPEMDGYEFARYIRGKEQYRHIPLLALSAVFDDEKGQEVAREAGFDSFISKLNQEAMVDSLRKISQAKGR